MAFMPRRDLFKERLCQALGLNPSHVRQLAIEVKPQSFVTAYVQLYVDAAEADSVAAALAEATATDDVRVTPCADIVINDQGEVRATRATFRAAASPVPGREKRPLDAQSVDFQTTIDGTPCRVLLSEEVEAIDTPSGAPAEIRRAVGWVTRVGLTAGHFEVGRNIQVEHPMFTGTLRVRGQDGRVVSNGAYRIGGQP